MKLQLWTLLRTIVSITVSILVSKLNELKLNIHIGIEKNDFFLNQNKMRNFENEFS